MDYANYPSVRVSTPLGEVLVIVKQPNEVGVIAGQYRGSVAPLMIRRVPYELSVDFTWLAQSGVWIDNGKFLIIRRIEGDLPHERPDLAFNSATYRKLMDCARQAVIDALAAPENAGIMNLAIATASYNRIVEIQHEVTRAEEAVEAAQIKLDQARARLDAAKNAAMRGEVIERVQ